MTTILTILVIVIFFAPFLVGLFKGLRANKRAFSSFVRVVDGDTVAIGGKRLRLRGIDAPEMDTKAGVRSRDALIALIGQEPVRVVPYGTDRYGRTLVDAFRADGQNLATLLRRSGHARRWN